MTAGQHRAVVVYDGIDPYQQISVVHVINVGFLRQTVRIIAEKHLGTHVAQIAAEQIVGKAAYDMTNFDLNAGVLQFTFNGTPIGKIGVHFESFEASVRSALEQARKAWAEKRANKQ